MDTLILVLRDRKLRDQFEKLPIQLPSGVPATKFLREADPAVAQAALGVPGDLLAAQDPEKTIAKAVKKAVFEFAVLNFKHEQAKPPAKQKDICEFQIVVMFHQSDKIAAKGITDGLISVGTDAKWYKMPFDYDRAHRVSRVWLMSCESAADETGRGNPDLMRYVIQSNLMREAASDGVMTFQEPPRPSAGPLVSLYPDVYTFSTGNPVTGGLKMHPNHASFVNTPNWEVHNGVIREIPNTPDVELPSGGTVYKYSDHSDTPTKSDVPKGQEINILSDPPPF